MTNLDAPPFRALVKHLAAGRGKTMSAAQLDGLWVLLADVPYADVNAGLLASARDDRYFPQAQLIRQRIDDVQRSRDRVVALAAAPADDGVAVCARCDDTGWAPVRRADGAPLNMADLVGVATDAYGVRPCACREHNPTYQAKRARAADGRVRRAERD